METTRIISWLRDKAARAEDLSWQRMLKAAADRMAELSGGDKDINVPSTNVCGYCQADAVEVVRCINCRKWDEKTGACDEFTTHRFPAGGKLRFLTRENDFCSYGERKR